MGDRQFFAGFCRMNASPAVFFFSPLSSFITTGLFLFFLVYFIPSHFILVTLLFSLFRLSQVNSVNTSTPVPARKVMFMFTLDLGDALELMFLRD